jgi:predicted transcriptional regulator
LPLHTADLRFAKRIQVLCEASSRRFDTPQTSVHTHPSTLRMSLNGVRVYEATVPDHPHDARGALSYLRGGLGAHGFLARAVMEGDQMHQIAERGHDDYLRLRCEVPAEAFVKGGLTIYGAECGRYPVSPTVIVEW